jgi:hypothetical protein
MTPTQGEPRAGPELDALVLQSVLGWEWLPIDWPDGPAKQVLWNTAWGVPRGGDFRPLDDTRLVPWDAPRPSTSITDAWDMEVEIGRRRLRYPYVVALSAIVANVRRVDPDLSDGWRLLRATPEQRCRAAIRAAGYKDTEPPSRPTGTGRARPKLSAIADEPQARLSPEGYAGEAGRRQRAV